MENLDYKKEYDEFVEKYQEGLPTNSEQVGLFICRLVQFYSGSNLANGNAKISYNKIAKETAESTDENTGKAISMAKATVVADATQEAATLILTKVDVENLEQQINAMKMLQRGSANEYSHMGNT